MKLLVFSSGYRAHLHIKNRTALERMCASCGIEFEHTTHLHRIQSQPDYDILFVTNEFVDISIVPHHVKIVYGPQFWVFPEGPMVGPLDDQYRTRAVYNCLSQWVHTLYIETAQSLRAPIVTLPFSVDTSKFKPAYPREEPLYDCIVYWKRRANTTLRTTLDYLDQCRLKYIVFTYGSYNEVAYLHALHHTKWVLAIDAHESQGFALEEAMSTDVPLLVLDATSMYDEIDNGRVIYENKRPLKLSATSVPYWSEGETGLRITSLNELPSAIDTMIEMYASYRPRDYILRTLSDEVCMRRVLTTLGMRC